MTDLMILDGCRADKPVLLSDSRVGPSPLVVGQWESHLKLHPDQNFAGFIVRGLREGFRIGFNYASSKCSQGRIMGPLDPSKFLDVHIS